MSRCRLAPSKAGNNFITGLFIKDVTVGFPRESEVT